MLLRALVGAAAVAQGGFLIANTGNPTLMTWLCVALAVTTGGSLIIGFLTPAASATVGAVFLGIALAEWTGLVLSSILDGSSALFLIADAVAIILIGPGAFSLDARLFGRREIVIPHESHTTDS